MGGATTIDNDADLYRGIRENGQSALGWDLVSCAFADGPPPLGLFPPSRESRGGECQYGQKGLFPTIVASIRVGRIAAGRLCPVHDPVVRLAHLR